jgi:hypothetical protein
MGRSSPCHRKRGSRSPGDKGKKKKKERKHRRSKSSSIKETGSFERILNNYVSPASHPDEKWMNLALDVRPLCELAHDRARLMREVFSIIADAELCAMLPDVLKKQNYSLDELKELLSSECKRMDDAELQSALNGKQVLHQMTEAAAAAERNNPSSSTTTTPTEHPVDKQTRSYLDIEGNAEPTQSQMELLELEMRARAIKSLMHVQDSDPKATLEGALNQAAARSVAAAKTDPVDKAAHSAESVPSVETKPNSVLPDSSSSDNDVLITEISDDGEI